MPRKTRWRLALSVAPLLGLHALDAAAQGPAVRSCDPANSPYTFRADGLDVYPGASLCQTDGSAAPSPHSKGSALHYCDPAHPYPGASMCQADGSPRPTPRSVEFRELIVDADGLAKDNAYIEVVGVYQGVGEVSVLWPPGHRSLDFNDDKMLLLTENSPRDVREFLYDCRRRVVAAQNNGRMVIGCRVRITGHMTLCVPKISPLFSAGSPCLTVEAVDFDQ
jgi:hypothetical protein